ncbi:MAG: DUF4199 domain-containing protein [Chitinophagaceae bacterium]|nr:DUF4199 domain-containing protein [Chitinophagaceae bacterium]
MEQTPTSHVVKGLIISLILIIISIVSYFLDLSMDSWVQYLSYAIFIAGVIASCIVYGKQHGGHVTFGNTFAHGFKVSSVVAVLMVVFVLLFALIFPEMKDKALIAIQESMSKNPAVTQDMIDSTMTMYTKWFTPIMIASAIFGYLFVGLIASLIGAAVTKKNPNPTPQVNV